MRRLTLILGLWITSTASAAELGRGEVYSVIEIALQGPVAAATDSPARDVDLWVRFRHDGGAEHKVYGFWDGGSDYRVRFTPTHLGRWTLAEVHSNRRELQGQKQGDWITARASKHHGFWVTDEGSAGRRWYRRSDGSHQYIIGNTHYTFLSGYRDGGRPSGNDITADIARNAEYFRKLRFTLHGDRYPHPTEKPFLDDTGRPTDSGDWSHRLNPKWFRERADVAVRAAFERDLIADLILCGPDVEESRATLRARQNNGNATPWLKYIAARYGSYANVWLCLCNEYDIRVPAFAPAEIAQFGVAIREFLPYPTPLSVHVSHLPLWNPKFDELPRWSDHHIIQRKIRVLPESSDVMAGVWRASRQRPTVNDELSYQGEGDKHSEADTLEAHVGAFLGGGYGTTGWKTGNKLGHYFWGRFDPAEHTAASGLKFLREVIDGGITFWNLAPDVRIFENLDDGSRGMAWAGREYVLGTNRARERIVANLPPGSWTVEMHDVIARRSRRLSSAASGRFTFSSPASRAVLFHFQRVR